MNLKSWVAKCIAVFMLSSVMGLAIANEGHGGGGGGGSADSLALEPLTINLKDGHYIQFKPLIKLYDVADAEFVRASIPIVRFELIKYMIGRDISEVGGVKFMRDFSEDAADALNKVLRDDIIKEVLYDTWLVQ